MMQNLALASLEGVHKRFGAVAALDGVDLEILPGEVLAVLGPNGAGKTTAISVLLGLTRPSAGIVRLFGMRPGQVAARRNIGIMMQEAGLAGELSVRELVALTSSYYPNPLKLNDAIALAGVDAIEKRPYGKLSGGQKRMTQFALAICGAPPLLFLDEPTANLDAAARETLWQTVRTLVARGASVVLTTHYVEEAEALASRIALMGKGRVIASGTVKEIRSVISRKHVTCTSSLDPGELRGWAEVDEARIKQGRLCVTTPTAEALMRRLLAADPALADLEVRSASLSEALARITESHS